jgi:hypothetical protein
MARFDILDIDIDIDVRLVCMNAPGPAIGESRYLPAATLLPGTRNLF